MISQQFLLSTLPIILVIAFFLLALADIGRRSTLTAWLQVLFAFGGCIWMAWLVFIAELGFNMFRFVLLGFFVIGFFRSLKILNSVKNQAASD